MIESNFVMGCGYDGCNWKSRPYNNDSLCYVEYLRHLNQEHNVFPPISLGSQNLSKDVKVGVPIEDKDNKYVTRYTYSVSVFFGWVDRSRYKCKVCDQTFETAKLAKLHFNWAHKDVLERYADLGYVGKYFVRSSTRSQTRSQSPVDIIRRHREQILRKLEHGWFFGGPEMTPEKLASLFHEYYEEEAEKTGWKTQEETRVPFNSLPEANRLTMISTCRRIMEVLK